ncbi:hypothetical protein ACLOJK_003306 [Asimina triloba]
MHVLHDVKTPKNHVVLRTTKPDRPCRYSSSPHDSNAVILLALIPPATISAHRMAIVCRLLITMAILALVIFGSIAAAGREIPAVGACLPSSSSSSSLPSSSTTSSCFDDAMEDKRVVPGGPNPLHNR